jgi:hypothetical protein
LGAPLPGAARGAGCLTTRYRAEPHHGGRVIPLGRGRTCPGARSPRAQAQFALLPRFSGRSSVSLSWSSVSTKCQLMPTGRESYGCGVLVGHGLRGEGATR